MRRPIFLFLILSFIPLFLLLFEINDTEDPAKLQVGTNLKYHSSQFQTVSASNKYSKGNIFRYFFGQHHRNIWRVSVQVRLLNLHKEKFVITGTGGNMQTVSLKLKGSDNRSYVVRPLDKDQSKALPKFWRKTFVGFLVKDQASAMFPYGALVVAELLNHVGIMHASPTLVYLPADTSLKKLPPSLGNEVGLLEEAPDDTWAHTAQFEKAQDIIDTETLLKKIFTTGPTRQVDIDAFLKCRLMDILINDWDRHAGQWRWAEIHNGNKAVYKPIPKDRDMAFYLFDDGLINKAALLFNPKFQSFHPTYNHVAALVYNGSYLDKLLLCGISKKAFISVAKNIQQALPDAVIQQAIGKLPPEVKAIAGHNLVSTLCARRDHLSNAAGDYYNVLNKEALLAGSDNSDDIQITRLQNGETRVVIQHAETKNTIIEKIFSKETQVIRIEAMGGNDAITITGQVKDGPTLSIYGGNGKDMYIDSSAGDGCFKKNILIDTKESILSGSGNNTKNCLYHETVQELNRVGLRE